MNEFNDSFNETSRRRTDAFKVEEANSKRSARRFGALIVSIWAVSIILSLSFYGIIIWGIIKLVNHFTG